MQLDDVRKTIEAAVSQLTPTRAQELARSLLDPGAAKDQVARTAADLLEWSHRSREKMRQLVRREIQDQVKGVGIATQTELDALRKRVRELERAAGLTASGRRKGRVSGGDGAKEKTVTRSSSSTARAKRPTARKRATAKATTAS